MSEDGELSSDSPKSNDDGFVIDRSFSAVIEEEQEENTEVTTTTTSEDVKKDSEGEPEAQKKAMPETPKSSGGGPSEWQKQMRRRLLEEVDPITDGAPQAKRRRVNLCFNCRGEHSIAQCPEPKDFVAIRKNKQEFQAQNQNSGGGPGAGRISKINDNNGNSESKFKPGRLSQELRDALDLGPDDIPEWVYRMRMMGFHKGYPPGYLRKSLKQEHETLKIFTEDTKPRTSNDVDDSEDARPAPVVQQNLVHFYMGFNKTYRALKDRDERRFDVPPFETFISMLQEQVSKDHEISEKYRRREARERRAEIQKRREEEKMESGDVEDEIFVIDTKKTDEDSGEGTSSGDKGAVTPKKELEDDEEIKERLGESIHQLVGTPIISRRDASGVWISPTTPTLEQFAVGIVPFEAKEEEKPRGIFQKIKAIFQGKKEDKKEEK